MAAFQAAGSCLPEECAISFFHTTGDTTAASDELDWVLQEQLARRYPNWEQGIEEESAVHRSYNINTNFDVIEISGAFDRSARAALNVAVRSLVVSRSVDHDALSASEDVLRLRDPTDALVRRVSRPAAVSWIESTLSDAEFTSFSDLERLKTEYALRDGDWVTVFEDTAQRTGDRFGTMSPQRANLARVLIFGWPCGSRAPALRDVDRDILGRARRNAYRYEVSSACCEVPRARAAPIVAVTHRAFRGRHTPDLAAVIPGLVSEFARAPLHVDPFGYLGAEGSVVRSIEWQEAFDQGRRLHEPRSVGFLLQMKRGTAQEYRDFDAPRTLGVRQRTTNYR